MQSTESQSTTIKYVVLPFYRWYSESEFLKVTQHRMILTSKLPVRHRSKNWEKSTKNPLIGILKIVKNCMLLIQHKQFTSYIKSTLWTSTNLKERQTVIEKLSILTENIFLWL